MVRIINDQDSSPLASDVAVQRCVWTLRRRPDDLAGLFETHSTNALNFGKVLKLRDLVEASTEECLAADDDVVSAQSFGRNVGIAEEEGIRRPVLLGC